MRAKEIFYVVDNTDYPEIVLDPNYIPSKFVWGDQTLDISMSLEIKSTYTSNNKYYVWNVVFIIVLSVLGGVLLISVLVYWRKVFVLNRYVQERRLLKQELMKIKDTEYTNFLLRESENLRKTNEIRNRAINQSVNEEDFSD